MPAKPFTELLLLPVLLVRALTLWCVEPAKVPNAAWIFLVEARSPTSARILVRKWALARSSLTVGFDFVDQAAFTLRKATFAEALYVPVGSEPRVVAAQRPAPGAVSPTMVD